MLEGDELLGGVALDGGVVLEQLVVEGWVAGVQDHGGHGLGEAEGAAVEQVGRHGAGVEGHVSHCSVGRGHAWVVQVVVVQAWRWCRRCRLGGSVQAVRVDDGGGGMQRVGLEGMRGTRDESAGLVKAKAECAIRVAP